MAAWHHAARWRALRLQALRRDGWRCVRCGARHGLEVDHIAPREDRPDLAHDLDNLQVLCGPCHAAKTAAEQGRKADPERRKWRAAVAGLAKNP
ncbi:MAG: HNH endonuclease [Alphaproteobacteria bacterium]